MDVPSCFSSTAVQWSAPLNWCVTSAIMRTLIVSTGESSAVIEWQRGTGVPGAETAEQQNPATPLAARLPRVSTRREGGKNSLRAEALLEDGREVIDHPAIVSVPVVPEQRDTYVCLA